MADEERLTGEEVRLLVIRRLENILSELHEKRRRLGEQMFDIQNVGVTPCPSEVDQEIYLYNYGEVAGLFEGMRRINDLGKELTDPLLHESNDEEEGDERKDFS